MNEKGKMLQEISAVYVHVILRVIKCREEMKN